MIKTCKQNSNFMRTENCGLMHLLAKCQDIDNTN